MLQAQLELYNERCCTFLYLPLQAHLLQAQLELYDVLATASTRRCNSAHFRGGGSAAVLVGSVQLLVVVVKVQENAR